jgi:hypothetical protein
MLIEWTTENEPAIDRILWVPPGGEFAVGIRLEDRRALPRKILASELESALHSDHCRVLEIDPFSSLHRPDETFPITHLTRRDERWNRISAIIELGPERQFDPPWRGKVIRELVEKRGIQKKIIYSCLRRYWQGGQIKNALLPQFDRCGGRGKTRVYSQKPGRKNGAFIEAKLGPGIVVGPRERQNLQKGYRMFYENSDGHSMRTAYRKTLDRFFHNGYRLENAILVPVLPPVDHLPTFAQFRYCNYKERDTKRFVIRRDGERKFNLESRPRVGNAEQVTHGPGSLYQLDSSVVDLLIVNSLDRARVLGQPTVYFVIDVFSRLIAGFTVTFGGSNCTGALLALENAACSKQEFCREHGVEILKEEWPSEHLPESLLADRRELKDSTADALAHSLGISLLLTPPFRPDLNGVVEGSFSRLKSQMTRRLPGHIRRIEGCATSNSQPVLDVHQFTCALIHYILAYNRTSLEDYRLTPAMISDHVDARPVDLWGWGIRNCSGHLRSFDQNSLRRILLPKAEASITEKGLHFGRCRYLNEHALDDDWFVDARRNGSTKIQIHFDPRKVGAVYLLDSGKEFESWHLCDSDSRFSVCYAAEVEDVFTWQSAKKSLDRLDDDLTRTKYEAQVERIVEDAFRLRPRTSTPRGLRRTHPSRVVKGDGTLMNIVKKARKSDETAYDALKARQLIRGVAELLP